MLRKSFTFEIGVNSLFLSHFWSEFLANNHKKHSKVGNTGYSINQVMREVRVQATATTLESAKIASEAKNKLDDVVKKEVRSKRSLARVVDRKRNKGVPKRDPTPERIVDWKIPNELKVIGNLEDMFLLHDDSKSLC